MANTQQKEEFIKTVGANVVRVCALRGYGNAQAWTAICQAAKETLWGTSEKMVSSNGYFGIRATPKWVERAAYGGLVYLANTKECYDGKTLVTVPNSAFRAYNSLYDSVCDYFDLLETTRYKAALSTQTVEECITTIINSGYATAPDYIPTLIQLYNNNKSLIEKWHVTSLSAVSTAAAIPAKITTPVTTKSAQKLIDIAMSWMGFNEAAGTHKPIIDLYNTKATGYKMTYKDPWCATAVSAAVIAAGYTDFMPIECSCNRMIKKYQDIGCWQEDESVTPQPGWVIFYDWQDNGIGDNIGQADHVGIVLSVENGTIRVWEGNYKNAVGIRTIRVNDKGIRGYGVPKYSDTNVVSKSSEYIIGNSYTTQVDLFVRKTPAGEKQPYDKMTPDGQKHSTKDNEGNGILTKGTRVTCQGIQKLANSNVWMQIPSGYICAVNGPNKIYIS